jgi:predicted nucleic acid-binding protein
VRLLFDTNVVLDVLLAREPHAGPAVALFALVERGILRGLLGSTAVTTVHYLAEKHAGRVAARDHVRTLLGLFDVAGVTKDTLLEALDSSFADFEDAVLYHAATASDVDGVVTRDRAGFRESQLPVFSPTELLAALDASDSDS